MDPQCLLMSVFFFFNDTATTEIYTLSLHDALPIWRFGRRTGAGGGRQPGSDGAFSDRKSTRLNSSHLGISYAVFCLKKKRNIECNRESHKEGETKARDLVERIYR